MFQTASYFLFFEQATTYVFLEIFGVRLEHLLVFIVQNFQIFLNFFTVFLLFY
jgi:hypothetical protein